jgi:hypothetical protein
MFGVLRPVLRRGIKRFASGAQFNDELGGLLVLLLVGTIWISEMISVSL